MHPLEHTLSVVGPIVGGIMVLTLFFITIGWIGRKTAAADALALKGVVDPQTLCTVRLENGTTYENVRLVGFVDARVSKEQSYQLPQLHGMVILEHLDGRRTLLDGKSIQAIDVPSKNT